MIAGILLAAGSSSRFQGNKLCTKIETTKHARQMIGLISCQKLQAACDQVYVISNEHNNALNTALTQSGIVLINNTETGRGVSYSIKLGIQALPSHCQAFVIALADMPFLHQHTLERIASLLRKQNAIVAPYYKGQRGHPVGFDMHYGEQLLSLKGDHGAQQILAQYRDEIIQVQTDDPGVILDIDYREDIQRATQLLFP